MDFDAHFQGFLVSTVNLKPWKLELLDTRVGAITNAFQADTTVGSMYKEHIPQGSWAQQTIINPVGQFDEFDADILLHLEQNDEWNENPKKYLQQVRAAYKRNTTYQSMVRRKNRCVRIGYANDCHVDVVPSVTLNDGRQVIINYAEDEFEDTNPVGFADWMIERDNITGGNLRRVIRLLKWLRDFKNTFSCPSVILTVMLGNRVRYWDADTRYADIPTTLVHLLEDLVTWLEEHPTMPLLDDPSCPGTSFNHRWDDAQYATFKTKAADYATWAREAYDLQDAEDQAALAAWQKLFGPEFAADEVKDARTQVLADKAQRAIADLAIGPGKAPTNDVAPQEEFIQNRYGSVRLRYNARIDAMVLGNPAKNLRRMRVVPKNRNLRFHLVTDTPEPYEVLWKVRNHGPEAARVPGELRGQIRHGGSEGRNLHRESTLYRGTHYVEAYVVKNGVVVASDHHDVTII